MTDTAGRTGIGRTRRAGHFVVAVAGAMTALVAGPGSAKELALQPRLAPGVVTLYRDTWGVPHIYAEREEDGFYALGYAQAEDQREGILSAALAVEGRAAAVFGDGELSWGIPMALVDPGALIWRHAEAARAAYVRLAPEMKRNHESYVEGFNAYLADHPDRVPAWAPKLEPWHLIGIPRTILWFFIIGDGLRDCAKATAQPVATQAELVAAIEPSHLFASNEWAVAPQRTADGTTMVLSDPHSIINGSLFYEFRMKAGGLDVLGYTFGTAMLLTHSDYVAWGMTTGGPDVSDCYELTLDLKRPDRYRVHGTWRTFETRRWVREVKGKAPFEGATDYAVINGYTAPVVARAEGKAYAIVTPYVDDAAGLHEQLDAMVRARNVAEVRKAAERRGMFPQNVLVGDREGSLFYLRDGRAPQRDATLDWTVPVSGDDLRTRWRGLHPSADLVQVLDPPTGYLQNNNTPPYNMTADRSLLPASAYAPYLYNMQPGLSFFSRADRTNAVLEASPRLTLDGAKALAQDELWIGTERFTEWLRRAVERDPPRVESWPPETQRVLRRLLAFDGVASAGSVAALNHYFWRTALWNLLTPDEQKRLPAALASTEGPVEFDQKAVSAIAQASAELLKRLGSVDRPYGEYFRVSRDGVHSWPVGGGPPLELQDYSRCEPLEKPPYVCALTQRAMAFRGTLPDGRQRLTEGSRALRLVVFGEPLRTYSLHNYGQSDAPDSPHYADQARLLTSARALKSVPFTLAELAPVVLRTQVFDRGP